MPKDDWSYLREKFPDQYENKLSRSIDAHSWLHAKIVVDANGGIGVFVNDDNKPSLTNSFFSLSNCNILSYKDTI